jgi:hypothetical protein
MRPFLLLIFLMPVAASPALPQGGQPVPRGIRQADQTEEQTQKNIPPPMPRRSTADLAKMGQEANDLARIAQTIPPDLAAVQKGILSSDLVSKLKQIEKLSKHLRGELTQ